MLIWKLVVLLSYFYISSKLASLRIIFIPIFSKQKTSGHFAQEKRVLAMQDLVFIVWSLHSCAKAEISQTTMALVERVFMETNLQMKTSSWNMVAQVIIFLFFEEAWSQLTCINVQTSEGKLNSKYLTIVSILWKGNSMVAEWQIRAFFTSCFLYKLIYIRLQFKVSLI